MLKKVYVEIGNMCNLHCQFCSLGTRKNRLMKASEFEQIAPQIKEFCDFIYLHVKGEPLMHPELEEILECCNKQKLKVNITTNGTKLGEKIEKLKKFDCIRQVNISAHAYSEISENDKEKYKSTLKDIVNYVDETRKFFLSIRFWIKNDLVYNEIMEYLFENTNIKLEEGTSRIGNNVFLSFDEEFEWPSLKGKFLGTHGKCKGCREQIAILANGDVVPCCLDSDGVMVLGNIFEKSFKEILDSERCLNIKKGFENNIAYEELCQKCSYKLKFK